MTYKELLEDLKKLNSEQLEQGVIVYFSPFDAASVAVGGYLRNELSIGTVRGEDGRVVLGGQKDRHG